MCTALYGLLLWCVVWVTVEVSSYDGAAGDSMEVDEERTDRRRNWR